MSWIVEFLDEDVKAALSRRTCELKHLEGPLWEMRVKGRSGIARAVYITAVGKRIVVVHVFHKKTQKTPRREIETALKGATEVQ